MSLLFQLKRLLNLFRDKPGFTMGLLTDAGLWCSNWGGLHASPSLFWERAGSGTSAENDIKIAVLDMAQARVHGHAFFCFQAIFPEDLSPMVEYEND